MKNLKILFMQSQPVLYADSLIHITLMQNLIQQGVEVHAACTYNPAGEKPDSLKALEALPDLRLRPTYFGPSVHSGESKPGLGEVLTGLVKTPVSLTSLASYIRKNKIDVIHCSEKPRDAFYGLLLARATGAKFLIHLHVKVENWISPLTRWAMRRADALVGVSEFVAQSCAGMGYPKERIRYVLNGLDLPGWQSDLSGRQGEGNGAGVRAEFGFDAGTPLLLAVARLVYYKGHAELLQAVGKVKEQVPDVRLLVVGEGDQSPNGFPAQLRSQVGALGISENVVFTGFRKDVRRLMSASDVFVLPSFEEPFGMVFVEAMAMEMPIVALDNGGSREIVEHGKSGLLSLPKDIDHFANNILTLLKNPARRAEMGQYGRTRVEQYFNAVRMTRDFMQLYQVIAHPGMESQYARTMTAQSK